MLNEYLQQVQRFAREQRQEFLNPADLISYINRARREVAQRTQCIRVLTPSSGSIINYTVSDGGIGYSENPTVTVSTPDFPSGFPPNPNGVQAQASAIVVDGVIQNVVSQVGGEGYFQPVVTVTDPTGTGAVVTPVVGGVNLLNQGQERYAFKDIDLSGNPGCAAVYYIRSVTIIYSNYRYSLPMYSFSVYQARIRQYPYQYQYVPAFSSQFGQGTEGTLFLYPLPSQAYQVEYDCQCLPSDLVDDQSVEAIPQNWRDAVPYFAAHLAFLELQNFNAAKAYLDLYEKFALAYSQYARVGRAVNPYGRY